MLKNFTVKDDYIVGVISDTHGSLPQSVFTVFEDADLIVHAGDIGKPEILESLGQIAPVIGVRGNMDVGHWARHLPEKKVIKISQIMLCVTHDVYRSEFSPNSNKCQIVISGHTHRPLVEKHRKVLLLNPGSAVQPRYGYPASVALLRIRGETLETRLIELKD